MNAFDALLDVARASWRAAGAPGRVLVAVSGGADSVGLLRVLDALRSELGFTLAAAHVDHGLRAESPADAAFVRALCEKLAVPCSIARLSLTRADENAAREARYAALYERAEAFDANVVALAHHAGDQAETVLMRLSRGSGGDGLSGMAALRAVDGKAFSLWRPFLSVSPDGIRDALRQIDQTWREDASNHSDDYFRNRVRHHVLPALGVGATDNIARAAGILYEESDYLNAVARDFLADHACLSPPCVFLEAPPFDALPIAIKRRALRIVLKSLGIDGDYRSIDRLMSLRPGEKDNLPLGFRAERTALRLHFIPPMPSLLPLGALAQLPFTGSPGNGKRAQAAPLGALNGAALRYRLPGDVIHPLGMKGKKSLQDYLVDQKVDRPFRDHLPLLCQGGEVLWVIGVGASERLRVAGGAPSALYQYIGRLPMDTKEEALPYGTDGCTL